MYFSGNRDGMSRKEFEALNAPGIPVESESLCHDADYSRGVGAGMTDPIYTYI